MKKTNTYNGIAWFYDRLAKWIFKDAILASQRALLHNMPSNSTILWIGGGSGIAMEVLHMQSSNCSLDFVDASQKMLDLAKKQGQHLDSNLSSQFILGDVEDIPEKDYDVIITFYFLDLFKPKKQSWVFHQLNNKLKKGGIWLCADFLPPKKTTHKLLVHLMFGFLKVFTRIESHRIEPIQPLFESGFLEKETHSFFDGLLYSKRYEKL